MTRGHLPVMQCDGDDGLCGATETDYYETAASSVGGVQVTAAARAPGWVSVGDEDYCPEHRTEAVTGDAE